MVVDGQPFKLLVVTSEEHVENEAAKITALLEAGVDCVHIRKPSWSTREVKTLIEDIDYRLRHRLRLHGHFELLSEFNLAGAHLNSRCPTVPALARSLSRSCHSLEEVQQASGYSYVTLSPIFDSISKPGYQSRFPLDERLRETIKHRNVIALGGVKLEDFPLLARAGFGGAAMLGSIWKADTSRFDLLIKKIRKLCCNS